MTLDFSDIFDGTPHRRKDRIKSDILQQILDKPMISRKELAHVLRLRPSSVSIAVQELLEDAAVQEHVPTESAQRGRPEVALSIVQDRWLAGCIFMESREFRAVLIDVTSKIYPLREVDTCKEESDKNLQFNDVLLGLVRSFPEFSRAVGLGLSMPGFELENNHSWVSTTRNFRSNVRTTDVELKRLGLKALWIHSLDARLRGILLRNPKYRVGKTALFHWGYGIGVSLSVDGTLLNTSFKKFGEIGHTIVQPNDGLLCRCGATGCLETEAALWAMMPSLKERFGSVPENEREFGPFLSGRFLEEIPEVIHAIHYINLALINLSKLFSPDRVLLYGPFTDQDSVFTQLESMFRDNKPKEEFSAITLERVQHDPLDEVIGATHPLFMQALQVDLRAET